MKKLLIVLTLLVGSNFSTFANEEPTKVVNVKALDGLKFRVTIPELIEKGTVAIKNLAGQTIYSEKLSDETSFVKVYSLAGFPDGTYYFEVKLEDEVITKEVSINTTVKREASVN